MRGVEVQGAAAKQTSVTRSGGVHTLRTAQALAGPILPGERGNRDTGLQEAIPVGKGGQGAALQDQLWVSLHGLDWRQTGREQRTRTDTQVGHLHMC